MTVGSCDFALSESSPTRKELELSDGPVFATSRLTNGVNWSRVVRLRLLSPVLFKT